MKKIKVFISVFVLIFGVAVSSFADDLLSVYQFALKNDPKFRAAQAAYQAQREIKNQSIALLLPTLSLSGNYSTRHDETITSSSRTPYNYNTQGYNLNLVQPLYRHANFVGLTKADAQVTQALLIFESEKQNLILRVATRYFGVLSAKDNLAFVKAEHTAIHQQLIQSELRFNVGLIAITDVHEAQARYDQSVARTIVAENALAISHETLREITATKHLNFSSLSTKHPLVEPTPSNIEQWVQMAISQNALLLASQKNVDVAQAEVNRQRAAHYPTLDLTAERSFIDYGAGSSGGERKLKGTTLSLQFNMPLFQGGIVNSRTRAAAFRLTEAREQFEQQTRATKRQTRTSYLSVIANISQVKALKQALASSTIALEATQAGFDVGTRTVVDVLDSQRGLHGAQRDYAQIRYNYVLETLKLKLAAGRLSAQDLEQLNPWLK